MKPDSIKMIISALNKSKVSYILSNESILGLSEGDVNKYSHNLHFFIFNNSIAKMLLFSIFCLFKKIIVKPKVVNERLRYKIRRRNPFFIKEDSYAWLHILDKTKNGWFSIIGKRKIEFHKKELQLNELDYMYFEKVSICVPKNWESLIIKSKEKLLADYYPKHNIKFDKNNEKKAIILLKSIVKIINNLEIEYWLEGGTLLGAIRDNKLIPWDHDLDIGIKFSNENKIKELINFLKKDFYVKKLRFPDDPKIWNLGKYRLLKVYSKKSYLKKGDICLDIFLYYKGEVQNKGKMYKYVVWGQNAYHETKFFDTIDEINFYNYIFKIPSFSKEFLNNKYGADWKVPKKKWNVALDDGSILR